MIAEAITSELIRGARPQSHQDLKDLGCTAVIELQSGVFEFFHNDTYEYEKAENFDLAGYAIKCNDFFPPSTNQARKFLSIIKRNQRTYVHCLHGKDRTGFLCAVYNMQILGWDYSKAVKDMFDHGFHKWPYIWWVPFLYKFRKNVPLIINGESR